LYGHVIDWIEIPNWPIFNIADSAIFIAAGIAIILTTKNISPTAKSGNNE
jgi:signal peptidase II